MQSLRDKARELVSIAEGELLKKEGTILALRRELAKVRGELAAANAQQRAVRSEKCRGCIYKLASLQALEEKEKVKK
ncbi:unnamed protein product [marine sediment metagenome]|uniref:Uncharacterized protein n=1 Tax=marine sediment metagenome TaxID=412755 RepID=X1N2M1_9ZZZZ